MARPAIPTFLHVLSLAAGGSCHPYIAALELSVPSDRGPLAHLFIYICLCLCLCLSHPSKPPLPLRIARVLALKMSLPRVSSLESFSFVPSERQSRRNSDVSVRARKLSFNPMPEAWDPPLLKTDAIQAVGAFEVPKWKRIRRCPPT